MLQIYLKENSQRYNFFKRCSDYAFQNISDNLHKKTSEFLNRIVQIWEINEENNQQMMKIKIFSLLLCLVLCIYTQNDIADKATPILDATGFSSSQIVLPFPWPGRKCCNRHNIYAIDNSGSMFGSPWSQAQAYVSSVWGTSDYVSSFTFNTAVINYYLHAITPVFSWPGSPGGGTNFNIALNRVSFILSQNFPDRTCIYFVSDGYFSISTVAYTGFLNALTRFKRKTGCPVCIKCIQTRWTSNSQTNPTFKKFCDQIGATFTRPGIIPIFYAEQFIKRQTFKLDDLLKQEIFAKDYYEWKRESTQNRKDLEFP